jgi:hypothetical protein
MTFNFTIFLCFSNIRNHLSNFSYLVCISCTIFIRWRFYLFLKTENSRRVVESRSVCMDLKTVGTDPTFSRRIFSLTNSNSNTLFNHGKISSGVQTITKIQNKNYNKQNNLLSMSAVETKLYTLILNRKFDFPRVQWNTFHCTLASAIVLYVLFHCTIRFIPLHSLRFRQIASVKMLLIRIY